VDRLSRDPDYRRRRPEVRRYEDRQVTVTRTVEVGAICDRCGVAEAAAEFGSLIAVAIEVNYGEEFGRRDEYDYCNPCLVTVADTLVAAGSRSELVGADDPDQDPQAGEG
jgi:hypothetical protein